MTSPLETFHFLPLLPREIRAEIWSYTLPGPRILHVVPHKPFDPLSSSPQPPHSAQHPSLSGTTTHRTTEGPALQSYTTNPCSYGAQHPVALSVCRESRAEALRKLKWMFNAYWDLEKDFLYIEVPFTKIAEYAMGFVADMRTRGLLDGVRNVAFDWLAWHVKGGEQCMTALRLLPNVRTCAFVFRNAPRGVIDVVDAGVAWKLGPVKHWCGGREGPKLVVKERMNVDKVDNAKDWEERRTSPEITWNEIEDRKFGDMPRKPMDWSDWRTPEPPGQDWFG